MIMKSRARREEAGLFMITGVLMCRGFMITGVVGCRMT